MQVTITFRGMESTESLKSYVKERIEHIEKYFDRAVEAHAVLSLERYLHHADITIQAGSYLLRGKVKSEDMYKSIDEAVDKIEKQLKRYKDKMKTTKRGPREDEAAQGPPRGLPGPRAGGGRDLGRGPARSSAATSSSSSR